MDIWPLVLGDFLRRENPFSAAYEPRLRGQYCNIDDRLHRAWQRFSMSIPAVILVPLITQFALVPYFRSAGLDEVSVNFIVRLSYFLPALYMTYHLSSGFGAYWERRVMLRDAAKLRLEEHDLDAMIRQRRENGAS